MAVLHEPIEDAPATAHDGSGLVSLRADVESLSQELLNRYEEIALLYDLSRELGVVTDLESSSHTALVRTLQVIPARWGVIVVGSGADDVVEVASAGNDPSGGYAAVAHPAAAAAMRLVSQVMVHAGGTVDESLSTSDPVLAVPLLSHHSGTEDVSVEGVLVLVGHDRDDRFSAGDAQLATAVARQLSLGVENARIVAQLREKEGLDRELELAADIQRSLLPAVAPPLLNASLAAACLPAAQVGGDYFDFVSGDDGVVHMVVADVTGHGLGPGMIMAMTRIALRAELSSAQSLPEAIAATNKVMWDDLLATGAFITLYTARFDPGTRELTYVNGGHHPALLRHLDGSVEDLDSEGMPLGVVPDPAYQEATRILEPGEFVVMFSDGIVEARAPDTTMYGTPRLRRLVADAGTDSSDALLGSLLEDLSHFLAGAVQDDDVTLVILHAEPLGCGETSSAGDPGTPEGSSRVAVIADDDGATRRVLTVLLEREGYQVLVAVDGASALRLIRETRPEVVFLDARMPAPDGYEVCRILRSELPPDTQPYVTMLTASGRDDDRERAAGVGVDEFLTKPFSPSRVSARLHVLRSGSVVPRSTSLGDGVPEPASHDRSGR